MSYPRAKHKANICKDCNGSGLIGHHSPPRSWECDRCEGTGVVGKRRHLLLLAIFCGMSWMAVVKGIADLC